MCVFQDEFRAAPAVLGRHALLLSVHGEEDVFPAGHFRLDDDLIVRTQTFGLHSDPRRAVLYKFKMCLRKQDQTDVSIEAAVEGKIRLLGIDAVRRTVVRDDRQEFVAGNDRECTAEGRIPAVMCGDQPAVQPDLA